MATITRGAVVLTPVLILPARLTRKARAVVHDILGDAEPDVTDRAPGLRSGELETLWPTPAAAAAAVEALAVSGGAWTIAGSGDADMTCRVVGDLVQEATADGVLARTVVVGVQEVAP